MSMMPLGLQPPPEAITEQSFNSTHHGSIGPVIAVLVLVVFLGILAVMIGRLCSGGRIMGYGDYDLETWAETKCSSCIDGRITPPPPPPPPPFQQPRTNNNNAQDNSDGASMSVQTHQESRQQGQGQQSSPSTPT